MSQTCLELQTYLTRYNDSISTENTTAENIKECFNTVRGIIYTLEEEEALTCKALLTRTIANAHEKGIISYTDVSYYTSMLSTLHTAILDKGDFIKYISNLFATFVSYGTVFRDQVIDTSLNYEDIQALAAFVNVAQKLSVYLKSENFYKYLVFQLKATQQFCKVANAGQGYERAKSLIDTLVAANTITVEQGAQLQEGLMLPISDFTAMIAKFFPVTEDPTAATSIFSQEA